MAGTSYLEAVLRHDRWVVIVSLATVTAASWLFVLSGAGTGMSVSGMTGIDLATGGSMRMAMETAAWSPAYAVIMFFMWWVMMIATMLPSASPTVLLFARIHRQGRGTGQSAGQPYVSAGVFAAGYLAIWALFSLLAVACQWGLQASGLLSHMMASTAAWLGGSLLLGAGIWQFTPWKHACLRHCRSPLSFLMTRWQNGARGAFAMGVEHGLFCLGCCWFLMALLFFGGIMNLYWIGGLALWVLLEKTTPAGHWFGYAAGGLLVIWGGWMLYGAAAG